MVPLVFKTSRTARSSLCEDSVLHDQAAVFTRLLTSSTSDRFNQAFHVATGFSLDLVYRNGEQGIGELKPTTTVINSAIRHPWAKAGTDVA